MSFSSLQILVLNEETAIVAAFLVFGSGIYINLGPAIGKFFDGYADDVQSNLKKIDDSVLTSINSTLAVYKNVRKKYCQHAYSS